MNDTEHITVSSAPESTSGYPLLGAIDSPADIKKLPVEKLPDLCAELRRFIIANCSQNPGHFASSMGAVEIAVALHYVFDTPTDHLVWDVGHQAYAHKILTGRRDAFSRLRTEGGPSGFPTPAESEYDTFTAGHASNSISAALGMAIADSITPGRENVKTVAIIGDASISGGLAFEGLNNASNQPNNLLIILNDNDMSIDDNVGALHHYLSKIHTSAPYNRWRHNTYRLMRKCGLIDDNTKGRVTRLANSLKAFISRHQNIFEGLNVRYFGPIDGHDVVGLVQVLRELKNMSGPRLLHLRTVKGKGFATAELNPAEWHAPGKFDPVSGERLNKSAEGVPLLWQQVFGHTLVELVEHDDRVVGITAAMPSGTSVNMLLNRFPDRAFDVGISEGHAVTFAGGLAAAGKRPFVAIYSAFLQRAYDNIIHDVAIAGLPVCFCIDRAGVVGEDGVTHHGLFDLAYMNCIPGMTVGSPMDEETLRNMMATSLTHDGPMAIRYPRGQATTPEWRTPLRTIEIGRGRKISDAPEAKISILSIGPAGNDVQKAVRKLREGGIETRHYDMIWLRPIDEGILEEIAANSSAIVTVEDGTIHGGLGSTVASWLAGRGSSIPVRRLGVDNNWPAHAGVDRLKAIAGYDADAIADAVRNLYSTL